MSYHIGKYSVDNQSNRGWFIGSFMANEASRTEAVEIKYSEFSVGPTDHGMKISSTYECSILLEGTAKAIINGVEHIISAGDYVAIQPNTPNNLIAEIIEPVRIITVKAPCDPSAKKVITSSL